MGKLRECVSACVCVSLRACVCLWPWAVFLAASMTDEGPDLCFFFNNTRRRHRPRPEAPGGVKGILPWQRSTSAANELTRCSQTVKKPLSFAFFCLSLSLPLTLPLSLSLSLSLSLFSPGGSQILLCMSSRVLNPLSPARLPTLVGHH